MSPRNQFLIIGFFLFLLFLGGCSDEESPTGRAVTEASTIIIQVRTDDGSPLYNTEIYINDEYKGKTSRYGESKGTKTLVLTEENNVITVQKDGYLPFTDSILSTTKGEQTMTVVLEKVKTTYLVEVEDEDGPVSGARISLYANNGSSLVE